jgi:ATP-dependent DNA ligase
VTDQATRPGEGISLAGASRTSGNFITGVRVQTDLAPRNAGDSERPLAFVAVDLLRVDGQDLFDVPLLERKRLLDSLLLQHERVRVSPYTQPPLKPWLDSWRASGFRGAMLKAANSRYLPGRETDDWTSALASDRR